MKQLKQNVNHEECPKAEKLNTIIAYLREDVVQMLVSYFNEKGILYRYALFKAEWQLCYLDKNGLIDGILGMDRDIPFLGANQFVHDLTHNNKSCVLVTQSDLQNNPQQ